MAQQWIVEKKEAKKVFDVPVLCVYHVESRMLLSLFESKP